MPGAKLSRADRVALTRRELLDAAQRRFLRDGYHRTTLDDVADDAGHTKGAVYSAFGSKGRLFLALFDEFVERRVAEIRLLLAELAPAAGPFDERHWAIATLALANGIALERLIDPDGVPDDLMAFVQRRLLRPAAAG